MTLTSDKPKSWFAFLAVVALGFLVFAPLAIVGLSTHGIGLFLTGLTGAGVAWIVAAFLALWLATRVAEGRYRNLPRVPLRDQVWMLAVAALPIAVAIPSTAQAYPLAREELRACMDRDDALAARQSRLEASQRDNDREADAIASAGARLAEDLRTLDNTNTNAVAAYNARSAEHNRWVESHNRRVAESNSVSAELNAEQAAFASDCTSRTYYLRDRDAVLWERSYRH